MGAANSSNEISTTDSDSTNNFEEYVTKIRATTEFIAKLNDVGKEHPEDEYEIGDAKFWKEIFAKGNAVKAFFSSELRDIGKSDVIRKLEADTDLLDNLHGHFLPKFKNLPMYTLGDLEESSQIYQAIKEDTEYLRTKQNLEIISVMEVLNIHLYTLFALKKIQNAACREKLLFHGTNRRNLDGICESNLNYRLTGTNVGSRFGQGVSFSPCANYAHHYCDDSGEKVMFLVRVLIGKMKTGSRDVVFPEPGYDTTTNWNGKVLVKYEDDSFYPAYLIRFREKN